MSEYKTCPSCKQTLSKDMFGKDSRKNDGLRSYCKVCRNEKARQSYISRASYWVDYRKNNKEQLKQYSKEYRLKNKSNLTVKWTVYKKENYQARLDYVRKHRESNRALYANYSHKRRANLKSASFLIRQDELKKLLRNPCFYCGSKSEHIDHVIPISRGGCHSIGNLVSACAKCNTSKGAKTIMEWRLWLKALNLRHEKQRHKQTS